MYINADTLNTVLALSELLEQSWELWDCLDRLFGLMSIAMLVIMIGIALNGSTVITTGLEIFQASTKKMYYIVAVDLAFMQHAGDS